MIMVRRRQAIQRRWDKVPVVAEMIVDGKEEEKFLARLGVKEKSGTEWDKLQKSMHKSFYGEKLRSEMKLPTELLERSTKASRLRDERRWAEKAKRGEVTGERRRKRGDITTEEGFWKEYKREKEDGFYDELVKDRS